MRNRRLLFFAWRCAADRDHRRGAGIPGWNTKQFSFERIDADRVRLMREVEIEGEAGTPKPGQKFFADDLQMNVKTGELIAIGNVVFSTPTSRIAADSVDLQHQDQHRHVQGRERHRAARRSRHAQPQHVRHARARRVFLRREDREDRPDKYRITKGGFTTCVQPTARWEIVSGSATLKLDDYAMLKNAVVQVKDVPVFYLPMLYYPIQ